MAKRRCKFGRTSAGKCRKRRKKRLGRSMLTMRGPRCAGLKRNGKLKKGFRFTRGGGCPVSAKG